MHHLPMRGDGVEAWLKAKIAEGETRYDRHSVFAQDLLEEYQSRADRGEPMLAEE